MGKTNRLQSEKKSVIEGEKKSLVGFGGLVTST